MREYMETTEFILRSATEGMSILEELGGLRTQT
jgi:hypothetical protein